MRALTALALVFALGACRNKDAVNLDSEVDDPIVDEDGDGYAATGDCDDNDAAVNPGAEELCDGIDNDCDGDVDGGATDASTWYTDADSDGFGDDSTATEACDPPAGAVESGGDCDDSDPAYFPGAVEDDCADPSDYNCDGSVGYEDNDGDGYPACEECDDGDAAVNPDAEEVCNDVDDDCDGAIDDDDDSLNAETGAAYYADSDADGYGDGDDAQWACEAPEGYVADDSDCDDDDAAVNPGATEVCNDLDDDCDSLIDDADDSLDASTGDAFYSDADGDGYGDAGAALQACDAPSGAVSDSSDCDDSDAAVNPAATEVCNDLDDDCDGDIDDDDASLDAATGATFYSDADGDSYGDASAAVQACDTPSGAVSDSSDCDDSDAAVNPAATEVCNDLDDDCDGDLDDDDVSLDASTASTWYEDGDGDGYGDVSASSLACDAPSGTTSDSSDCDDGDSAINPGATEVCNDLDDDCDGDIDDDDASLDASTGATWFDDLDGDGFGDAASAVDACDAPSGMIADDNDCDDGDGSINPSASESCDSVDEDCDSSVDEGLEGSEAACSATDCLDILTNDPSATDGSYYVDLNGTPTLTECDMSTDGGGWTLVFSDDFESGPDSGWSQQSTYSCGSFSTILGGYGIQAYGTMSNTINLGSVAHSELRAEVEYVKLDSWDGETAYIELDGSRVWSASLYYYQGSEVCGWNRGYNGSYDDIHAISEVVSHSANSLTFTAGSTLNQGATDESFGIDDVYIWVR